MRQLFIEEPYRWLQSCFFQPVSFKQDLESPVLSRRMIMILRLMPLLFLYSYSPALLLRIIIFGLRPDLYPYYGGALKPFALNTGLFLFDAAWAAALSCLIAGLFGGLFNVRFGIAVALATSIANAIIVHTIDDTLVGVVCGLAFGLVIGITFNSANAVKQGGIEHVTRASLAGVATGLLVGGFTGTFIGYWAGFAVGTLHPELQNQTNIWGSIAGLIAGGMTGSLIVFLIGLLAQQVLKEKKEAVAIGVRVGIAVAGAFGVAVGVPVGDAGMNHLTLIQGIDAGIQEEIIVGIAFLFCYLISYYRLPLYPFSATSTIQAYLAGQSKRGSMLSYLHASSLHWDECVFLPLPYLKTMLLLAAEQNLGGTLDEINYIVQERPQQNRAARTTAYELALRDLQRRTILSDIGLTHQQLARLVPQKVRELNFSAEKVFRHLDDASLEATSYLTQANQRDRQAALERMLSYLKKIPIETAFRSSELNHRLKAVVEQWSILAAQGQETLGSMTTNHFIDNPYAPGNPLELRDPLFVGRDDIVQKLGQALQKKYRPTFVLTGERRMGKSSILKQLPVLLGPRYIPIFYDLQTPGVLANAASFLAAVAVGIEKQCRERGIAIQKLERSALNEAQQHGEMVAYDLFEQWLQQLEPVLEERDRIIILAFDEWEKIGDIEGREGMSLQLLFDWFRSIMQNRPRLALLFSGAKMVGDMGRSWASYFVNVERLKVTFLRPADGHDLIIRPVPHIFNEEVTLEIMRLTHCHPFFIQAICKQIIEVLNEDAREAAMPPDVERAIAEIFEVWAVYFWDLWDRCDEDQHTCLLALLTLQHATLDQLVDHTSLSQQSTRSALGKLLLRDIVLLEQGSYQIAVPTFARWVERYHLPLAS